MLRKLAVGMGLALTVMVLVGGMISCSSEPEVPTMIVWSSCLLREPYTELNRAFEKEHNCRVIYCRLPESTLAKSVSHYDITADIVSTRCIHLSKGKRFRHVIKSFDCVCQSRWVIIKLKENPIEISSIQDLARPGVRIGFCAKRTEYNSFTEVTITQIAEKAGIGKEFWENVPEGIDCGGMCALVPAGVKAECIDIEAMDRVSYYYQVYTQLLADVADVCIVDKIITLWPEIKDRVEVIPIEEEFYPEGSTSFGMGTLSYSRQKDLAHKYVAFLNSEKGVQIFEKYGLTWGTR